MNESETPRPAETPVSNKPDRTTYKIVIGFVLALVLLIALNWN